jgi:hypothetical protein
VKRTYKGKDKARKKDYQKHPIASPLIGRRKNVLTSKIKNSVKYIHTLTMTKMASLCLYDHSVILAMSRCELLLNDIAFNARTRTVMLRKNKKCC